VKPVAAWASGPFEARLAFERALDPALAKSVFGRTITFEEARPTSTKPVASGGATPNSAHDERGSLKVAAARLDDDGRTLVLTTDPHPRPGTYSLALPEVSAAYDLNGVEVTWDDGTENASPLGKAWWPTLDLSDARALAGKAPAFAASLGRLEKPGRLTLTTLVTLPKGPVVLRVTGNVPVKATLGGEEPESQGAGKPAVFRVESSGDPTLLTVDVRTGLRPDRGEQTLQMTVQSGDDAKSERPVGREALLLPWAPTPPAAPAPLQNVPELAGGDPKKGAEVFVSAEAKCSNCHKVRGQGGEVGPDLSDLAGRERLDVYRDIAEPSARIHPDYVPYTLALKDGRVLVGTVRAQGADAVKVTDTEAKSVVVPRAEIEEFRPSATSIMPVGLAGVIGEAKLRDLVAFLTAPAATAPAGK
jgi:putative heme-binding domain-containing protein